MPEEPFSELIGRLTSEYMLRIYSNTARLQNGSWESGAILLAVTQYSSGHVDADPALFAAYASVHPVDAARRPISVAALARSVLLPRETVRRYVAALVERGVLARTARGGLIVPMSFILSPGVQENAAAVPIGFIEMLRTLKEAGYLFPADEAAASRTKKVDFPVNFIARTAGAYVFRIYYEAMSTSLGLLEFFIELAVTDHSLGGIAPEEHQRLSLAGAVPPQHILRPMAVAAVAEDLHLPQSTAYRLMRKLVAAGRLVRSGSGYVVSESLLRERIQRATRTSAYFRSMVRTLQQQMSIAEIIAAAPALRQSPPGWPNLPRA